MIDKARSTEWELYRPSRHSRFQVTDSNILIHVESGTHIAPTGAVNLEDADGTTIIRDSDADSVLRVTTPGQRGDHITELKVGDDAAWWCREIPSFSISSLMEKEGAHRSKRKFLGGRVRIPFTVIETGLKVLFFLFLAVQLFVIEGAFKHSAPASHEPVPTEIDTSDEYLPQTDKPLTVPGTPSASQSPSSGR